MPRDWAHFIIALLFHDIGYVKGICKADRGYVVATGSGQETLRCRAAAPMQRWPPIT